MRTALGLVLTVCLFGIISAFSQDSSADVRKAVDAGNAKYIGAFSKLDANALAAVYDQDGVRLGPKGTYARGRDAIAKKVNQFMQSVSGPIKVTIDTTNLWVVDATAYETGKYTYTFTLTGKNESQVGGHYATIWKKQADKSWRILADMGVSDD
jgi:uncharacterized protein (TIGR02246 family)